MPSLCQVSAGAPVHPGPSAGQVTATAVTGAPAFTAGCRIRLLNTMFPEAAEAAQAVLIHVTGRTTLCRQPAGIISLLLKVTGISPSTSPQAAAAATWTWAVTSTRGGTERKAPAVRTTWWWLRKTGATAVVTPAYRFPTVTGTRTGRMADQPISHAAADPAPPAQALPQAHPAQAHPPAQAQAQAPLPPAAAISTTYSEPAAPTDRARSTSGSTKTRSLPSLSAPA